MKYLWIVSIYNPSKVSYRRLAVTAENLHEAEESAKGWLVKDDRVQQTSRVCSTQDDVSREI